MSPKRPGTADDRDVFTPKTPPTGIAKQLAVPDEFQDEPLTGRIDLTVDELFEARRIRAAADPASRIALLETDQKKLATTQEEMGKDVAAVKVSVVKIEGDVKAQTVSLTNIDKTLERMATREDAAYLEKKKVATAEKLDAIDARKSRRDFWFKMAGSGVVGAIVLKVLQHFGVV